MSYDRTQICSLRRSVACNMRFGRLLPPWRCTRDAYGIYKAMKHAVERSGSLRTKSSFDSSCCMPRAAKSLVSSIITVSCLPPGFHLDTYMLLYDMSTTAISVWVGEVVSRLSALRWPHS